MIMLTISSRMKGETSDAEPAEVEKAKEVLDMATPKEASA